MAIRTTAANIKQIMEVDTSLTNLTPFITMASLQVDQHCAGYDAIADAVLLELVERNLAAHHTCMRDPRTSSERVSSVAATYITPTDGKYLEATIYGQTAIALDHKGGLSRLQTQMLKGFVPFSMGWVGVPTEARALEIMKETYS